MAPARPSTPISPSEAAPPRRGRGRPRAVGVDERILAAARALEQEVGYDAISVEAIAERAGVAKTALYRRWPNKGVLLYEAVVGAVETHPSIPDTGAIRADLLAVLAANAEGFRSPARRGLVAALSADALRDPRLAELLRTRFFGPRADAIVARVERAIARGELAEGLDAAMVPVLLTGSLQYLWVVRGRALDDADLERVVDAVIGAFVPEGSRR
jgi:AcrR family transcriptional regulator